MKLGLGTLKQFSPLQISNLVGWFDASDADALTVEGGAVASLANKAASGFAALAQATSTARPAYVSSGRNGRSTMRFDGTDDTLVTDTYTVGTVSTVFAVLKPLSIAGANRDFITAGGSSNTEAHISFYNNGTGKFVLYSGANLSTTETVTSDAWAYLCSVTNGASSRARWNGAGVTGSAGSQSWINGLRIGRSAPGVFHNTEYAEIIVSTRALALAEILLVEQYLKSKWGF